MNLIPLAVLIVAAVSALSALVVGATHPRWVRTLDRFAPETRARWLLALLGSPLLLGLGALGLVVGHCLVPALVGGEDDCLNLHDSLGCFFCIARPGPASWFAWTLALGALVRPILQLASSVRAVAQARRVARALRSIAREAAGPGVWSVPGAAAFVLAWPEPQVCIGEDVVARLDAAHLRAVLAHEGSHLQRRDIALRLGARFLGVFHFVPARGVLLDALDVAIEQRSDEDATHAVRDPLIVAQALVDVAHLQRAGDGPAMCGVALQARVEALCDSRWESAGRFTAVATAAALTFATVAVYYGHRVHVAAGQMARLLAP